MNAPNAPVVVVIPGDLHLTEPGLENVRVAHWVVDQANALIQPDFVQFIGDNVQNARESEFDLFDTIRARLLRPHFALVGDHDVKDDPAAERFRARVSESHGSFSLRGFRFILLNTLQAHPLGISDAQIRWFRGEVDQALEKNERIVIFQHHYPFQIWETFDGPGISDWREIVQTRRIEAILCGHTHYWQVANDGRNVAIATRSIGDPEGGAPGYTLLHLQGADLAVRYRSIDERGPLVLITHPRETLLATAPCHVVKSGFVARARVWSRARVERVQYRIDEAASSEMERDADGFWIAAIEALSLTKGEHRIDVRAIDQVGAEGRQRQGFLVDPTGRYTAVPCARPVVTSTKFC